MIVIDDRFVWIGLNSGVDSGLVHIYDASAVRAGSVPQLVRKLDHPITDLLFCPLPGSEYVLASTYDGYLNVMQAHARRSVLKSIFRKKEVLQRIKVCTEMFTGLYFDRSWRSKQPVET